MRRFLVTVAVLLTAVGIIAATIWLFNATAEVGNTPSPGPDAAAAASDTPERPADAFAMTVEYVIDGDTVKARVVEPNEVLPTTEPISVRLIGIDTPEVHPDTECWGVEASASLSALLPEGSTVWAAPDEEWRDRYDRALLYLWAEDGRFLNLELVRAGDAETLVVEPNDAYSALFAEAEASARAEGVGQWDTCAAR
ncbi:thermonuclease family protein [Microbacterium sp. 2FI]|uniref:thermonuclease family protein n=1 Tax=Microbacterium sp. 2FI TaxID=2502193 RepID=UPI0010F58746|nr:thermonuclease family protein [Microbacterium sp. 2FI]